MAKQAFNNHVDDLGDFADSDDECEVEIASEPLERYHDNLYYPVSIGEVLDRRYRIEHKLGWGGFSTVWMAVDLSDGRDVALKIMVHGESGENEYLTHNKITQVVKDTSRLLLYKRTFILHAPNAKHRVLVLPLQGPNLRDYYCQVRPAPLRMSVALQLLQALKSLHDGEIVHRDLNSANVMHSLRRLEDCDITTKYELLGRPQKVAIPELWKSGELVAPITPQENLVESTIFLGDFGLAIESGTELGFKIQSPLTFCAPERIHGHNPSFASDMWSYMCIFASLYLNAPLFKGSATSTVVTSLVDTFGPLPVSWKGFYDGTDLSDDTWYGCQRVPEKTMTLEARIKRLRPEIDIEEFEMAMSVLRWGFSYHPDDRPTAAQLLEDGSFKALLGKYYPR